MSAVGDRHNDRLGSFHSDHNSHWPVPTAHVEHDVAQGTAAVLRAEAAVYRLLKAQELISPAYVVIRRGPHSTNLRRDMRQML